MGTKHAVQESGIVPLWMESGGTLRVTNVLWVPELRRHIESYKCAMGARTQEESALSLND
jgi:hypothetical protein